jgi:hypothetical protein
MISLSENGFVKSATGTHRRHRRHRAWWLHYLRLQITRFGQNASAILHCTDADRFSSATAKSGGALGERNFPYFAR